MSEQNYPLHWPHGWPRTKSHAVKRSRFGTYSRPVQMGAALDFLIEELKRLGAQHEVVSTNVRPRLDGRPYAGQAAPQDAGVAVYFTLKQRRVVLACDRWQKVEENVWAVAKHIEALRGQERWGVGSIEQAFAGYTALPQKSQASVWDALGIASPETATEASVMAAWREAAKRAHPDIGGSHEAMTSLNTAKDIALATILERRRA